MDNLARIAKPHGGKIILTWACPGQGGNGSINCKHKSYVIEEIEKRGVTYNEASTTWFWERIHSAYAENLMIFSKP